MSEQDQAFEIHEEPPAPALLMSGLASITSLTVEVDELIEQTLKMFDNKKKGLLDRVFHRNKVTDFSNQLIAISERIRSAHAPTIEFLETDLSSGVRSLVDPARIDIAWNTVRATYQFLPPSFISNET
jgi:hypothetical protein